MSPHQSARKPRAGSHHASATNADVAINRAPDLQTVPSELAPINGLKPYGVGRTLAFAKMKAGGDQYDPTFPTSLVIHGRHYFVRAEMLQWALQHRNRRAGKGQ